MPEFKILEVTNSLPFDLFFSLGFYSALYIITIGIVIYIIKELLYMF